MVGIGNVFGIGVKPAGMAESFYPKSFFVTHRLGNFFLKIRKRTEEPNMPVLGWNMYNTTFSHRINMNTFLHSLFYN